jgi:hypothetical protein
MAKLTLSVDDRVISRAKQYAKQRGLSISGMVEAYLAAVADPPAPAKGVAPIEVSMKRILFDTNILLDVLLDRQPYVESSAAAWAAVETGISEGMLAAHAVTTIHHLIRKETATPRPSVIVSAIVRVFGVAAVDGAVIQEALQLPFSDFECRNRGRRAVGGL